MCQSRKGEVEMRQNGWRIFQVKETAFKSSCVLYLRDRAVTLTARSEERDGSVGRKLRSFRVSMATGSAFDPRIMESHQII